MPETTDLFRRRVSFDRCMLYQIPEHFEKIKHWVPEDEWDQFKERMSDAVEMGGAWCTKNTFLYYIKQNKRIADAVAIFGKEDPSELLALLQGVFSKFDLNLAIMNFVTHDGKHIKEYISLLHRSAIKKWHQNHKAVLRIRIDHLREKLSKNIYQARDPRVISS